MALTTQPYDSTSAVMSSYSALLPLSPNRAGISKQLTSAHNPRRRWSATVPRLAEHYTTPAVPDSNGTTSVIHTCRHVRSYTCEHGTRRRYPPRTRCVTSKYLELYRTRTTSRRTSQLTLMSAPTCGSLGRVQPRRSIHACHQYRRL